MAIFMVQIKYNVTKTWLVEGHDEEFVLQEYSNGNLEMEYGEEAAFEHSDSELSGITRMEGEISKSVQEKVLRLTLHEFDVEEDEEVVDVDEEPDE